MSAIYSIPATSTAVDAPLKQVWIQGTKGLANGYTSLTQAVIGGKTILFAFAQGTQSLDTYTLTGTAPWVEKTTVKTVLAGGKWDQLSSFMLGNITYLLAYRADTGAMGFYQVGDDITISPPYLFAASHTTPSAGFTTIAPFMCLGAQYILGYDVTTGRVENFSVTAKIKSDSTEPPLLAVNIWYHLWAKGWQHFAFFQLGGSTFFFKINLQKDKAGKASADANIDHMHDLPALGAVEVGTKLLAKMKDMDGAKVTAAAIVPLSFGEPRLLTYIASSGTAAVYRIHADCMGWTLQSSSETFTGASIVIPYRIGDTSYALFYKGAAS